MAAALFLHRAGNSVDVFERFETVRPLGSGLLIQPSGQKILAALGLLDDLQALTAPVERLSGISVKSGKRALAMEYSSLGEGVHALGVHRAVLFGLLHKAMLARGIPVHPGCEINTEAVREHADGMTIEAGGQFHGFDFVVDAMGARSPLASGRSKALPYGAFWATVDMPPDSGIAVAALDQRYLAARQMAGIMPVGISPYTGRQAAAVFWSAQHHQVDAITAGGIERWRNDYCHLWSEARSFVDAVGSIEDLSFARYHHRTGRPVTGKRLFHIGDSWHCTSPQLGQGANMALIDAAALAEAIGLAGKAADIAPAYRSARQMHIRLYQALSRVFTPLYQSNDVFGPWLRDQVVHYSAILPPINRIVARIVAGDIGNRFSPRSSPAHDAGSPHR
jgi:salicylate hydroxylase